MKRLFFILFFLPLALPAQPCRQIEKLNATMARWHYRQLDPGTTISGEVFDLFLEELDPAALFFTKKEIEELATYKELLFDESSACKFLARTEILYRNSLRRADSLVQLIAAKPFDLNAKDSLQLLEKNQRPERPADVDALKKRWSRRMKYQVLKQVALGPSANAAELKKNLGKLEPAARDKIRRREKARIARLSNPRKGLGQEVGYVFLNAMAKRYDPHSDVYSKADLDAFRDALSPESASYGLAFDEDEDGQLVVAALSPGGAAWRSGQVHKGDVLQEIRTETGPGPDLVEYGAEELEEFLLAEALAKRMLMFTLRKTDGQTVTVPLQAEKSRDDNVVKSYVLKGDKKIGYISLPSFYMSEENTESLGCANDVAREIVKLQEENIDGLVLDLRFNGGGSVREAMGLAGIFVNEGPLCLYKNKSGKVSLMKDLNRGTIYGGPLVIMVNGLSASASEILAASLQDYKRAVVLGSSTYGKGSGQIVWPLDSTRLDGDYMKITVEQFYHLDNRTHQLKGVQPDLRLPEPHYLSYYREHVYPYTLPADSVVKKVMFSPLAPLPLEELRTRSSARARAGKFQELGWLNDSIRLSVARRSIPMDLEGFAKYIGTQQRLSVMMDSCLHGARPSYEAGNTAYDRKLLEIDYGGSELNKTLLEYLQRDIYVDEAYRVLLDLLSLTKP